MPVAFSSSVLGDIKRLSTHSAVYGLVGVSSGAVGMMLVPLYGHLFTPEEFGQFQLAQLWLSIAATVAGLGLMTAYFKLFHDYPSGEERGRTLGIVVVFLIASAGMGCVTFIALSLQTFTAHFAPLHDPWFLGIILMAFIGAVFISIPFQVLRAQERSVDYLKIGLSGMVTALLLNFILVGWFKTGVKGALAAQAMASLVIVAICLPIFTSHTRLGFSSTRARELLGFGLPLVPAAIALWVLEFSDRVVLEQFWGVKEVGIYSLAYKYGLILQMALVAFQTAWTPHLFSMAKQDAAPQMISRILTYVAAAMMMLATFLYALREPALSLIASTDFSGAQTVVGPILLGFLFYGFYFVAISGLYIHGKTFSIALVVGIAAGLNLLLNFLFIPQFGGLGAAWATAFSYLALGGMMYWHSQRHFPMYLEWGPVSGAATCCVTVAFLTDHLSVAGWAAWLIPSALVALIPVILWHGGFVTASERQQIRSYVSGWKWAGDAQ